MASTTVLIDAGPLDADCNSSGGGELRPERPVLRQPRAQPWVMCTREFVSPERAALGPPRWGFRFQMRPGTQGCALGCRNAGPCGPGAPATVGKV